MQFCSLFSENAMPNGRDNEKTNSLDGNLKIFEKRYVLQPNHLSESSSLKKYDQTEVPISVQARHQFECVRLFRQKRRAMA